MKNLSSKVRFDLDVITSLLTSEDGNPAFNKLAAEPDETKRQLLHFGIVLHSAPGIYYRASLHGDIVRISINNSFVSVN